MTLSYGRRYYCTNMEGCQYARADHAYGRRATCTGERNDGCGQPLSEGSYPGFRLSWLGVPATVMLCGAITFFGWKYFFPQPYAGFAFAEQFVNVKEGQATVALSIRRTKPGTESMVLRYHTVDGSAHAGHDYVDKDGSLTFSPADTSKTIDIALLPGGENDSIKKSFSVALSNVEGQPQQVIVIEPFVPDADTLGKADTLVRSLSGLSIDIAGLYVKRKILHRTVESSTADSKLRTLYADELGVLDTNMQKAQARYLQVLQDMKAIDRRSISRSFDTWSAKLDQEDLQQQRAATRIAQKQFGEFLQNELPQMDVWAQQLSDAIPKPGKSVNGIMPM